MEGFLAEPFPVPGTLAHAQEDRDQAATQFRQGILNLRRNLPVYLPVNQTVLFQFPQLPAQHPLGYFRNVAPEIAEAPDSLAAEPVENNGFPSAADRHERQLEKATIPLTCDLLRFTGLHPESPFSLYFMQVPDKKISTCHDRGMW